MKLGRDVFVALSTIVWADGVVTEDEARSLEDAARASGVADADMGPVRAALRTRPPKESLRALALDAEERGFVYAIAAWLARADGVVTPEETDALAELGDVFALDDDERACAIATSYAIDVFGEGGGKPSVHELTARISRAG
jgi:hypothetical protein